MAIMIYWKIWYCFTWEEEQIEIFVKVNENGNRKMDRWNLFFKISKYNLGISQVLGRLSPGFNSADIL